MFFEGLVFYINHGILSRPIDIPLVSVEKRNVKKKGIKRISLIGFIYRRTQVS
jgi:hypothetical protein